MIISLAKINLGGGGSGGGSLSEQDEYVIALALNDLNERLNGLDERLTEVENNEPQL